jgi:hypothetical protein
MARDGAAKAKALPVVSTYYYLFHCVWWQPLNLPRGLCS